MKIINLLLVAFLFISCSKDNGVKENVLEKPYEQILNEARGSEVSIYMWGGSKEVNNYFDEFVIPNVKELYDIKINRVPIDDVKSVLQKIELEKNSNKKGSIDIIWINGENFKIAKTKDLLYGSFVSKLPNYNAYVDSKNKSNLLDFSEPTNLLEAPFGRAQFVMVYDSSKVTNPPKNTKELFSWIKNNPGRFSYPAIPDFTGSAFVRQLFLSSIGGIENFDKDNYKSKLKMFFKKLNDIKPYMFKNGSYLPKSSALLDTLYANGSVDFTFSYNPSHALNKIKTSNFPKSSKTAIFEGGTLANTHFLTISKTASNPKAAMVVINFLLSPTAQYKKAQSDVWGDGTVLDLNKLDDDFKVKFSNLTSNSALLDSKILQENQIPELSADYIEEIEKIWKKDVLQK
jgi:putative spermidine/putrescine transport system substrate-binding protein